MFDDADVIPIEPRGGFRPYVITARPAISVVGLGYVGAVSCACLAGLGHRVVGVDIDPVRVELIGRGDAPIHEQDLGPKLAEAVARGALEATADIGAAVAATDVTFISVGTPTGDDGGCDFRHLDAACAGIGAALAGKAGFHTIVLRCSVPPGTTHARVGALIERASGKAIGTDFGLAFVPEFLREGVAVDDFHNPPKTVIGASDDRTAAILARIFEAVDDAPVFTGIETAELVKYVDNVWHALKVCFGNEVGRLSKALDVDGREVMDVFCRDTKLNLSPCYLKPGFAYGGSCLPKEVRAVGSLSGAAGVDLPLIGSLERSNAAQIEEALRLVRATKARRVAVLGLAFKPGTDDLRESPILEVMAALMDDGATLAAHDAAVTAETPIARQLAYVAHGAPGLGRLAACLPDLLHGTAEAALEGAEAVIVCHDHPEYRPAVAKAGCPVIDLARLFDRRSGDGYAGIGW